MNRMNSNSGVALIIVLWSIVILSFLVFSLVEDIQLESFLTRNLMEETRIHHIAQAGIARGLAELIGDETLADGKDDDWLLPIKGLIEEDGSFEVTIEDIGSKFNINYIGHPVIESLIPDYLDEFIVWRSENYPFFTFNDLETFSNINFFDLENYITFYGKFNINTGDLRILREIMIKKDIPDWIADRIVVELDEIEQPFKSIDDLLLNVPDLDMTTFDKIRDELEIKGNININLVTEEVLYLLTDSLGIHRDIALSILDTRDREVISDLGVLERTLGADIVNKLELYLDVTSKYFRIISKARSKTSAINKTIVIEVERIPEQVSRDRVLKWQTEILSWVEF